ncbi:MAG: hypothetical protein JXA82_06825 [Sedimentisphaerales bacterium]|nr:hypothetical protein [Sedimentisphaerales bacterium]
MWFLKSKKVLLTLAAMAVITVATLVVSDTERLQWFAAIIGGLVGSYNIGQGIADGWSKGQTSSSDTEEAGSGNA